MIISDLILNAGFKSIGYDSLSAVGLYQNEFYLLRVREWDNQIDFAYLDSFDRWPTSTIRTLVIAENLDITRGILEHYTKAPLNFSNIKSGDICGECADRFNLSWPKGHIATFWQGRCSQCEKNEMCCSTGDYNYLGKKVRGMRD